MSKKCSLRVVLGLFLAALLNASALATEQPPTLRSEPKSDAVIAVVNDEPITEAMLQAYAPTREWEVGDVSSPEARKRLIGELIDEALLFQEAQRLGLADDPQEAIRLALGRRETLATAAVRKFLEEYGPSEEAIHKEYEAMAPVLSPRSYHVRGIVVDSKTEAEAVLHKLHRGADFEALAEDHLMLDLGYLTPVQIQRYFGLSPHVLGEADPPVLYEQPVETEHGWRVIRIEDIREEPPPPLEEMRSTIVRILERRLYEAYVARLHEQAEIDNRWVE